MEKYNADAVWRETLTLIAQRVNEGTYRIWFEPTAALGFAEDTFVIGVASDFAKDWIDTRFRVLIADCLAQVLGDNIGCRVVVSPELARSVSEAHGEMDLPPPPSWPHTATPGEPARGAEEVTSDGGTTRRWRLAEAGLLSDSSVDSALSLPRVRSQPASAPAFPAAVIPGLNDKYTFESFVIGPSNRFAHAAALAAAETPGSAYNPLFLYGGVGLGKTHLLQAIGHYVVRQSPHLRVRFVTIEMFTNDFINSLRDDTIEGFKRRYRTNDVLLIDDIQFLQRKEQTQEEFFHTFNALYEAGKQIVISSDRHPKALLTLEDRLVSRFEWGLIVDIQPPDLETRIAILRKRVQAERIRVAEDDILTYIASRVSTNIRELEGCLTRVVAFCSFSGRPIDVVAAREVLRDIPETASTRITIDLILTAVSQLTGISVAEMKGDKRSRHIVEARHLAMYLARELTDESLPKIGDRLGGRDHTTVLHAVDKISKLMAENRTMYNQVQLLTTKIKSTR